MKELKYNHNEPDIPASVGLKESDMKLIDKKLAQIIRKNINLTQPNCGVSKCIKEIEKILLEDTRITRGFLLHYFNMLSEVIKKA
jgi:hypothetical protein